MPEQQPLVDVMPVGLWGRHPSYQAKVGTMPSSLIVVRRARRFRVGQRIEFEELHNLYGMRGGAAFIWQTGVIWKIEADRIYLDRE